MATIIKDAVGEARTIIGARINELHEELGHLERALKQLDGAEASAEIRKPPGKDRAKPKLPKPAKRAKRGQRQEELLAIIKKMPGASAAELADRIGIKSTQAHGLIRKAEAGKLVKKKGQGFEVTAKAT